ncbi:helix-turn-helix transcriptional regulator [Bifidobacterium moukalabense]|uniref:helix-turn-helix transcriptional regulator n=1 Tax=Bifidobacterium moukalabense TaxID=1333651 RepID=UPI0010F67062|nr:helix-turn-helix transcriptional regulator [Bifidobacterium moukalabense]
MVVKKKRQVNQVAETGHTVAANIKRLRGSMQYKQLTERLDNIGRPIAELGLRKIESGERKVDVDDLMAFAIVFGVSPLTLLLPEHASASILTEITGCDRKVSSKRAWEWGMCETPLPSKETEDTNNVARTLEAAELFKFRSSPKRIGGQSSTWPESGE